MQSIKIMTQVKKLFVQTPDIVATLLAMELKEEEVDGFVVASSELLKNLGMVVGGYLERSASSALFLDTPSERSISFRLTAR